MRTAPLLVAGAILLSAALSGCADAPDPQVARPSPPADLTPPSPALSVMPSASPSPTALAARLTGDGIDTAARVVVFGDTFEQAEPALRAALGAPTLDSGEQSSFGAYGTCPGSRLRALEFGGGALYVLFGDVIGPGLTMYQWSLTDQGRSADVPKASALVGDVTTFEFGVGDTLAELRSGTSGSELDVQPGDEMLPPSFRLADQSSGFFGSLNGNGDQAGITGVIAGEACGE